MNATKMESRKVAFIKKQGQWFKVVTYPERLSVMPIGRLLTLQEVIAKRLKERG